MTELRTNQNRISPWAIMKADGINYTIIAAGPINKQPMTVRHAIAVVEDFAKRPGQYQLVTLSWEFGHCRIAEVHGFNSYSLPEVIKQFTEKLQYCNKCFYDSLSRKDGD